MPAFEAVRFIGGAELIALKGCLDGRGITFLDDPPTLEMARQLSARDRLVLRKLAIDKGMKAEAFDALVPPPAPKLVEPPPKGAPRQDWWRAELINVRDLCDQRFPEIKYVVPGVIPEGITLLASRPKMGKSWLLLQICTAVASGAVTLVASDQPPQGDVLYLALEDNPKRLKRRLTKYFGSLKEMWPEHLTVVTKWRRLDQGGLEALREWCRSVKNPRLIAIDTLKRMRPPKRQGQSDYDADYEACQGLQQLAGDFGIAIIVAHHDRKMDAEDVFDTISGTLGLTGGVDTVAVIKRRAAGTTLHVEGRDLVEAIEKAIAFDREHCRWTVLGEAAEIQRSEVRRRVLAALQGAAEGLSVGEIMAGANLGSRNAADSVLFDMAKAGEIERVKRGIYGLPGTKARLAEEPDPKGASKIGKKARNAKKAKAPQAVEDGKPILPDLAAEQESKIEQDRQQDTKPLNAQANGPDLADLADLAGGLRGAVPDDFPDLPPELDRRRNPPAGDDDPDAWRSEP